MALVSKDIDLAVNILSNEDLVAIPTETVYGLAGNIFSEKAIKKIFQVKQRPFFNPLIVHIHQIEQVEEIAEEFPESAKRLAEKFWPGPLTLILKKKPIISDLISAGKDTVGIRMPNHPITSKLLQQLSFPVAAPSANPFNRISPTRALHVKNYFENEIQMVLDGGDCKKGIESTIIGFENGKPIMYRIGSLTIEEIEAVAGKVEIHNKKDEAPIAPGMLAKHYAPRTKTILVDDLENALTNRIETHIGILKFTKPIPQGVNKAYEILSSEGNLEEAASNLYNALHKLDSLNLELIIAERLPDEGLGKSINDRLERAAR